MTIDNTEFISVVHKLVSDSKECIDRLVEHSKNIDDENILVFLVSAASLLTIHNTLVTQLVEQNSAIVDRANDLLEKVRETEKKLNE